MNEIQRDYLAIIAKLKAYEKGVVDAKMRNKLISRTEELEVFASRLMNLGHVANQPYQDDPSAGPGCICVDQSNPDVLCPIHQLDSIPF